jgi:hypothetical protein
MAQIHEEVIIIRVSQLCKAGSDPVSLVTNDVLNTLSEASQALVGDGAIVEIDASED